MAEFKDLTLVFWDSPVAIGEKCRVALQFYYQGPAVTKSLHAAIGNDRPWWQGGFDEILAADDTIDLPYFGSLTKITTYVEIPITSAIDPDKSPYDLYAKADGLQSPIYTGVINVEAGGPPPEDEGSIIKRELDVDDRWQAIPVAVDKGTKTRVQVTTKNTGTTKYHPNCQWKVRNPQGQVADQYNNTAIDLSSPDETQEFRKEMWDTFELTEVGDYTIEIWLRSYESGKLLDYWSGRLCTVVAEEYKGSITDKQLEVSGIADHLDIPVSEEITQDSRAKVHVYTRNTGNVGFHPCCKWQIKGPSGSTIDGGYYEHCTVDTASPGEVDHFWESIATFTLTDIGDYSIEMWLTVEETGELLDHWEGKLCTVSEAPVPAEFRNFKIVDWLPDPAILAKGDSIEFHCSFEYRSSASKTVKVRAAIGDHLAGFWERDYKEIDVPLTPSDSWQTKDVYLTVIFNHPQLFLHTYDAYCKLMVGFLDEYFDYADNIITWGETPPGEVFENFAVSYIPGGA